MNPSWPKALVNGHLLKLEELWLQWFHMVPHTTTMCVLWIFVFGVPLKKPCNSSGNYNFAEIFFCVILAFSRRKSCLWRAKLQNSAHIIYGKV